jgi:tetratricopeptide (TPR) repeat protein
MRSLFFLLPLVLALLLINPPLSSQSQTGKLKRSGLAQQIFPLAQAEADSLKALLKAAPKGMERIEIYGQLCFTYASTIGDLGLAHQYADSITFLANRLQNKAGLASANYYHGMLARFGGKYTEALRYLNKQMDYCYAAGDSMGLANGLFQMAVAHHELGNYDQSLAASYRAKELYEKKRSPYGVGRVFMNIGNLFASMQKWEDAITMYQESLFSFNSMKQDLNAKMGKLRVLVNLGNAYSEKKEYEKASSYYKQALRIGNHLGANRTVATVLSNVGEVLNAGKQYDSALVYHLQALAIRQQASQRDKIADNLIRIGQTYIFLEDYTQAARYLFRALSLSKEFHSKPTLREAYLQFSVLYAGQGNFQKAYEYHRLFAAMQDSVLNEETSRRLSELQTKYEAGEKDKKIAILAKEKLVQQTEAQRQALLQKALAGGLFLVTVIALLFMYLLGQRMKTQKILMAKNQEITEANLNRRMSELEMKALRAQMNPHFIFNCMNSINRMILDGDTNCASRYLVKLSKLIRLMLENSENTSVSLAMELTMLDAYLQLENLRFKGRIRYEVSVQEAIDQENTFLPSMVLQPFVENAIWHGLMHKEKHEPGHIRICIEEAEDILTCVIEDNGVGREMASALSSRSVVSRKSMGLQITEERLRLFNKGNAGPLVQITDLKDPLDQALGTRVDIHVPLR